MSKKKEKYITAETIHPDEEGYDMFNGSELIPLSWIKKAYIDIGTQYAVVCLHVEDPYKNPKPVQANGLPNLHSNRNRLYINSGRYEDKATRMARANETLESLCRLMNNL